MKRWILSLIFILLITSFVYGATDRLVVRFQSTSQKQDINLKKYLGDSPFYYYNITNHNVLINIDQDGIAHITAKPGFKGVETIIFSTNSSRIYEKAPDKQDLTLLENLTETIIEKYPTLITDQELEKAFAGTVVDSLLLKSIKKEEIEKITSEIKEDELMVNVNDEALMVVAFENESRPKLTVVLFDESAKVDEDALKPNYSSYFIIGLIIIFIGGLVIYRDHIFMFIRRSGHQIIAKKQTLNKRLNDSKTAHDIKLLTEEILRNKFGLTRYSTPYEVEVILKKYKITGNLKQEILFLYRKSGEEHLSKYEIELIKRYLKDINKRF
ncbi:MAG: hypothetical protein PHG05_00785 [Candidatus Nanoarchaeia archaeon]|nr:hypothetical protein [Candidatus Nanoarchaeia archaeon]